MLTFSEILSELPQIEEQQPAITKYLGRFVILCLVMVGLLVGAGNYWSKTGLFYAAVIPLLLALAGMVLDAVYEARSSADLLREPGAWVADRLDHRFAQEKLLAAELATTDLVSLRRMSTRLDAELVRIERWLDVLKPLAMFLPAVALLITSNILHLPGVLQDIVKLMAAAGTLGVMYGAVSVYKAMVRLRTVSATLQHAINIAETSSKPSFRKVSRKRT